MTCGKLSITHKTGQHLDHPASVGDEQSVHLVLSTHARSISNLVNLPQPSEYTCVERTVVKLPQHQTELLPKRKLQIEVSETHEQIY
eukprot:1341712-Amphidinium_carterae.1